MIVVGVPPTTSRFVAAAVGAAVRRALEEGESAPADALALAELLLTAAEHGLEALVVSVGCANPRQNETISPAPSPGVDDVSVPLLTKAETADRLRISLRGVDRLAASGHLTRIKVGGATRFRRAEVDGLAEPREIA